MQLYRALESQEAERSINSERLDMYTRTNIALYGQRTDAALQYSSILLLHSIKSKSNYLVASRHVTDCEKCHSTERSIPFTRATIRKKFDIGATS
jgi:hypothetical protein